MSHNVIPANSDKTQHNNKIPEYAKDFKKEWLYIRGINKKCGEFLNRIYFSSRNLYKSPLANNIIYYIKKFLKYQEKGLLKDICGLYFEYFDVNKIFCLEKRMHRLYLSFLIQENNEIYNKFPDFF